MRRFCTIVFLLIMSAAYAAGQGQALYEQGMEAFKSGNYKNAELLFRKTIDADDEYTDRAWFYLAQSLYQQKRYKDALFEYNRFLLNCRTPNLAAESRFWIGESQNALGDYIKAIEEYKRFISMKNDKDDPLLSLSRERIGDIYYRQTRYDEALIEWKAALDLAGSKSDRKSPIGLKIARALFENKNYDDAETILTPLSSDKDIAVQSEALLYLGRINQAKNRHRIATRFFIRIPESQKAVLPFSNSLYFLALSYLELSEKDNAKTALQTFINVGKDSPLLNYAKFQYAVLTQAQNPAESLRVYEEIRKTTDNRDLKIQATIENARLLLSQGKPEQAIPLLEQIITADDSEKNKQILFDLGNAYLSVMNLDKAQKIFDDMMKRYTFDADADKIQFLLSVVHLRKGDSRLAAEGFQRIKDINPFSKYINESKYYIALAQYDQGSYKNAVKYSEEYLSIQNPEKRFEANVLILRSYIKLGDIQSSEKNAMNLIRRFPTTLGVERIILEYCKFLFVLGKENTAAESFLIKNFPDSDSTIDLYMTKGNTAFEKNDWAKADTNYSAILKIKGNDFNPQVFLRKTLCIYYAGNYNGVITFLNTEKLNQFNREISTQIVFLMARSYYLTGKYDKAYDSFVALKGNVLDDQDTFMYFDSALKNDNLIVARDLAAKLRDKPEYYYRTQFSYGSYYRDIFNYERSRTFFSQIYADNADSPIGEMALIELAGLDYREGRFEELLKRLKNVKSKIHDPKKGFLSIAAYIRLGKAQEATELVKKSGDDVLKNEEGRSIVRDLIVQLEDAGDINEVQAIGKILTTRYPSDSDYVNYYTGNLYYKQKVYDKALQFLMKIAPTNSEYKSEVFYKIGTIYELFQKNPRAASYYFAQVSDIKEYDEFVALSRLELAIIYFERGQKDQARKLLDDILARKENVSAKIKAANLYTYYGFDKEKRPTP
jgi:tetratricopeptide (TPR) repeat protein